MHETMAELPVASIHKGLRSLYSPELVVPCCFQRVIGAEAMSSQKAES